GPRPPTNQSHDEKRRRDARLRASGLRPPTNQSHGDPRRRTPATRPRAEPTKQKSKLRQESRIVFEEEAHVGDAVAEHRGAFDAEAEGEARVAFGVDAAVGEDVRVDHAGPEDLEPARPLADATRAARRVGAEDALDVHLGAGFDEGEVARTETD